MYWTDYMNCVCGVILACSPRMPSVVGYIPSDFKNKLEAQVSLYRSPDINKSS